MYKKDKRDYLTQTAEAIIARVRAADAPEDVVEYAIRKLTSDWDAMYPPEDVSDE